MPDKTTRRQAIKQLSLTGLALAAAPTACLTQSPPPRKLGVALVGLGNYATRQLGPALRHTQHCELRGIVTGTPSKEKTWQDQYDLSPEHTYSYDTFAAIGKDETIDIVYIVLPNFMHAEYTIRALEAGKHVICEKPMGMNAAECRQMIAAARKANRKLQIGYRLFYEPHHLALQEWARPPAERGIRLLETSLGFDMARPGMWRIDKDKGGGGALMDLGPYAIQAARRAVGSQPVRVRAQGFVDDPQLYQGIYGTYLWQLEFADGSVCNSSSSFSAYSDRYHVAKGNEYREIQPAFSANTPLSIDTWNNESTELAAAEFQQTTQLDAFAQNILKDTPVIASGEEGWIDMVVIDAIKESLNTNRAVAIRYEK